MYDTDCKYDDENAFMLVNPTVDGWLGAVPHYESDQWWCSFDMLVSTTYTDSDSDSESLESYLLENPNYRLLLSVPDLPLSKHYSYQTPEELFAAHPELTI